MSRRTIKIFILTICFFIIIGILGNVISKDIFLSKNTIRIYPNSIKSEQHNLSYRLMNINEPKIQKFTTTISKKDFDKLSYENHQLLIYKLTCQAYRVYFNDKYIGSLGDFIHGNSNVKNALMNFPIDRDSIKDENTLTIETFSLYDIGLSYLPIIICNQDTSNYILDWFNLLIYILNATSFSFTLIGFIILFVFYLLNKDNKKYYLYFSFSMLFLLFSLPEFMLIYRIPFSYIIYKKFMLFFSYASVSCLSMFLYKLFKNKLNSILAIIALTGIILICIFSNDLITLKHYYRIFDFILPINMLGWIYVCQKEFKQCDIAKVFCISSYLSLIFLIYNIILISRKDLCIVSTPILHITCLTGTAIAIVFLDYINKKKEIELANNIHIELYHKSTTDAMTGFYNHDYIISILKELSPDYSVIIIDIDDFKSVNDTYGHWIGDKAIEYVSDRIRSIASPTNIIGRYGGDEFLIISLDHDVESSINIIKKIYYAIDSLSFVVDNKLIPLTLSSGFYNVIEKESIDNIISKVDKALYQSKDNGKNQFSIFQNKL